MKALTVLDGTGTAALREHPVPEPGDGDVLIRVSHSGVSLGTELQMALGRDAWFGEPPFIPGYQVTGRVERVGASVTAIGRGDFVAAFSLHAHAPWTVCEEEMVQRIPEASLARSGALFVQPCVAANGLNHANVRSGDDVLVVGQGLVGQAAAMLARLRGAYVVTVDPSPTRRALSALHCADQAIDASTEELADRIGESFSDGVDVVVEASGHAPVVSQALRCCRPRGRFVFVGSHPEGVTYDPQVAQSRELTVHYSCFIGGPGVRAGVLRLMESRRLDVEALITHVLPWKDAAAGYERLVREGAEAGSGVVIDWRDSDD